MISSKMIVLQTKQLLLSTQNCNSYLGFKFVFCSAGPCSQSIKKKILVLTARVKIMWDKINLILSFT